MSGTAEMGGDPAHEVSATQDADAMLGGCGAPGQPPPRKT